MHVKFLSFTERTQTLHKDGKTAFKGKKQAGKKQKTIINGNKSRTKWKNFAEILKKKGNQEQDRQEDPSERETFKIKHKIISEYDPKAKKIKKKFK